MINEIDPVKQAMEMLKDGIDIQLISKYTKLNIEEIEELRSSLGTTVNIDKVEVPFENKSTEPNNSPPVATSNDKYIGKDIQGYKIEHIIGKGGMGSVYYAKNQYGDEAAIKFIATSLSDDHLKRFKREGKNQKSVKHDNVTKLIATVEFEGCPVIIMEYIHGDTLRKFIDKEKKVHFPRAIKLLIPICKGLAAIHNHGITHRDIKPRNIIISETGPKICDFGLSKSHSDTVLTEKNSLLGSHGYIAPELGEGKELDNRSDVFSLGVIIFEMLIGSKPIKSKNLIDYMVSVNNPISIPHESRKDLVNEMADIILKCLQKNPDDRYQNVDELIEDLQVIDYLSDAESETNFEERINFCNKAIATRPNLYAIYFCMGNAYYDSKKYEEAVNSYTEAIKRAPDYFNSYCNRGNAFFGQGKYTEAINDYTEAIKHNPNLANVYANRAQVFDLMNDHEKAANDYSKAISLGAKNPYAYEGRGLFYLSNGKYNEALADFQKAVKLDPQCSSVYYNISCVYSLQNNLGESIKYLQQAVDLGFNECKQIEEDKDLANIRHLPEYNEIIDKIKSKKEK